MLEANAFRLEIEATLHRIVADEAARYPAGELLRVDLHCHDCNSTVPDELLGRILGVSETWLPTDQLLDRLRRNGMDAVTVTNHNNARTCWDLLDRGADVLPGAEFTCTLPEFEVGVHVLTFGFTPSQEAELHKLRPNLCRFLAYAAEHDLPTVLAHPLHVYSPKGVPPDALFDVLGLLFERFEAVNGQRDSRQNALTAAWVASLDEEAIEETARRTGLRPNDFCREPYRKALCGGSDDHMGIFAGHTGSLLHVPGLERRRAAAPASQLALEALRAGRVVPFGSWNDEEKLVLAFLDYFCQVALNMKDPGLLRMLLHRGSARDKLLALLIGNAMLEIRRHRTTLRFLGAFHEALAGRRPGLWHSFAAPRPLRPLIEHLDEIAVAAGESSARLLEVTRRSLPGLFRSLNQLLRERVQRNLKMVDGPEVGGPLTLEDALRRFEIPSHLRALLGGEREKAGELLSAVDLGALVDGLSFPALASGVVAGAHFAGTRVLYKSRPLLDRLSARLGALEQPRRALWLTDTLFDRNGVSTALGAVLEEVRRRDLPVDFLTCAPERISEPHLVVLPPVAEFRLAAYPSHVFRVPDMLELHRVFGKGGYDRVVCSTEFVMGLLALYLKHAYCVPAHFFLHTDWLDFADRTLGVDAHLHDRVRRLLRAFYGAFDSLLVLNSEQREWLAGPLMGIPRERIVPTAHWVDERFRPEPADPAGVFFPGVRAGDPVILYAGRLSEEKGILELPGILGAVAVRFPNARLVLAGEGPVERELRTFLPDAVHLGWVPPGQLPRVYSSADVLLLPSRFDTFGCVVLEAFACGLPVVAYDTKGPRDIVQDGVNGFLADTPEGLATGITRILEDPKLQRSMRAAARERALDYTADVILRRLLADLGLGAGWPGRTPEAPAGSDRGVEELQGMFESSR
jgi:glycosyltransferase involved in cell wall biosynthesis